MSEGVARRAGGLGSLLPLEELERPADEGVARRAGGLGSRRPVAYHLVGCAGCEGPSVSELEHKRERLLAKLTEAGGRLRVRGAMNPILWLCGVVAIPCIIMLGLNKDAPPIISWVLVAVVSVALLGFLWLLFFDRDRLQSEEYLIRSRTLDLIEEKGSKKAIDAATVKAISEPEFLALPDAQDEDGK